MYQMPGMLQGRGDDVVVLSYVLRIADPSVCCASANLRRKTQRCRIRRRVQFCFFFLIECVGQTKEQKHMKV